MTTFWARSSAFVTFSPPWVSPMPTIPAVGPQFDDVAQEVRTVAAAGGQQRRVGKRDRRDFQAGDRQRRLPVPRRMSGFAR